MTWFGENTCVPTGLSHLKNTAQLDREKLIYNV
jgi:hypothetical protein